MWHHHCALFVLLGATYAYSTPVWFYNTGYGNADPTEIDCSYFTEEYDPSTGYYSYRCNPAAVTNNPLSGSPAQVQNIPAEAQNDDDEDSAEDDINIPVQQASRSSGSLGGLHDMVVYGPVTSGRSGSRRKNNKPRRPTNRRRRNRCPTGQIYQSEIDICIDYPSAPPLPPKRPSYSTLNPYDHMVGDAHVMASDSRQKPPSSGTVLLVGKIDIKNRCKPREVYVSELDICLPKNNCYPHGSTC
ncbi:unnamed protein product [Meganyctiphanes norvegica]|uniref:Uncharacterized protein n=1 Tax=Meganyctiphanes norvegica TaxID=48144 RepID=A0AAV2SP90_MEGNR